MCVQHCERAMACPAKALGAKCTPRGCPPALPGTPRHCSAQAAHSSLRPLPRPEAGPGPGTQRPRRRPAGAMPHAQQHWRRRQAARFCAQGGVRAGRLRARKHGDALVANTIAAPRRQHNAIHCSTAPPSSLARLASSFSALPASLDMLPDIPAEACPPFRITMLSFGSFATGHPAMLLHCSQR